MLFADRHEAGERLAIELMRYKAQQPVVIALPRGGVPVGFEIARAVDVPLDIVMVRKIGAPEAPELAIGAIAGRDRLENIIDRRMVAELGVSNRYIQQEIARQSSEIARRRRLYSSGRPPADLKGATAIVVDDGLATGATMRAALKAVRRDHPAKLVVAVPVAPASVLARLRPEVDEIVCLEAAERFVAVNQFYGDFQQVEDGEVIALLEAARTPRPPMPMPARTS